MHFPIALLQHVADTADTVVHQAVNELTSVMSKGIDLLSEVLGGPSPDGATIGASSDLHDPPASILGLHSIFRH